MPINYSERCRRMYILTETHDHFLNAIKGINTSGFLERRYFDSGP